jgi:hypothetical protein
MGVLKLEGTNNKAIIIQKENLSTLVSYETEVAYYDHLKNKMAVKGWYSATTARHINKFLQFYGFNTCTKKELESYL